MKSKKSRFFPFAVALFVAWFLAGTPVAHAAKEYRSYEEALNAKAPDGIVAFFFGPDWSRKNKEIHSAIWKNKTVRDACGNAALLTVPVYQDPSPKQKESAKKRLAGSSFPRATGYPCLFFCDTTGTFYAKISESELLGSPDVVAKLVSEKIALFREQRKLLAAAKKVSGVKRAEYVGQAACIDGIAPPKNAAKIIAKADPEGQTPYLKRLNYDVYKLITNEILARPEKGDAPNISIDEACTRVDNWVKDDTYLPRQKQELLAAVAAHIRRHDKSDPRFKAYLHEILKIDPKGLYAFYAEESLKVWGGNEKTPTKNDASKKKKR